MKVILNLEKVRNVKVHGLENPHAKSVALYVNYYDNEYPFEHIQPLLDLCKSAQKEAKESVRKAYDDIKQALFNNEKHVEIEL